MATDAQRLPVGDLPAIRPSTEEALLCANSPSHTTAPNALTFKGSDNVERLISSQLLQADGSAFPAALRPPTGEVYVFFDTNTSAPATVDSAGTVTPIGVGSFEIIGDIDCSANPNYPAASQGDAYRVSVAGKIGGGAGPDVQVGDIIVAWADNAGGTQAAVGADWSIEQGNLQPATSAEAIAGTDTLKYLVPSTMMAALQDSLANFAIQVGADVDAIVAATVPATTALVNGRVITLRKTAAVNTGAVTLNIGSGVVSVVKVAKDGTEIPLVADDLPPGNFSLVYNTAGGNRWILQNPKIPDIDITGNAASATSATNATNATAADTYAIRLEVNGGDSTPDRLMVYFETVAPGHALANGDGSFAFPVFAAPFPTHCVATVNCESGTGANPIIASGVTYDNTTGTISGKVTSFTGAGGLPVFAPDGTRIFIRAWGYQA